MSMLISKISMVISCHSRLRPGRISLFKIVRVLPQIGLCENASFENVEHIEKRLKEQKEELARSHSLEALFHSHEALSHLSATVAKEALTEINGRLAEFHRSDCQTLTVNKGS